MTDKYVVGSYFYNEDSEWGWKYGFTLNKEITRERLLELVKVIEQELNKKNEAPNIIIP